MTGNLTRSTEILRNLIRCPSVTPNEGGALSYLESELLKSGFEVHRLTFSEADTADVDNLYARIGKGSPHIMFAGHTDVVPPGNPDDWTHEPFAAVITDDKIFGRGAVDMKGGIACFLSAAQSFVSANEFKGSISLLITGDEEGPSINGTDKLLKWARDKGESWDAAIVGEPSNPNQVGDAIKNGRRGSLSGRIIVKGTQGHSAYPHLADNPINGLVDLLNALLGTPFDKGPRKQVRCRLTDMANPEAVQEPSKRRLTSVINCGQQFACRNAAKSFPRLQRLMARCGDPGGQLEYVLRRRHNTAIGSVDCLVLASLFSSRFLTAKASKLAFQGSDAFRISLSIGKCD